MCTFASQDAEVVAHRGGGKPRLLLEVAEADPVGGAATGVPQGVLVGKLGQKAHHGYPGRVGQGLEAALGEVLPLHGTIMPERAPTTKPTHQHKRVGTGGPISHRPKPIPIASFCPYPYGVYVEALHTIDTLGLV